jgi:DNA-binding NarL/FixJ family response regulator
MHRVYIVGHSLFADTLLQMLSESGQIEVLGLLDSIDCLPASIDNERPDAVIVADTRDRCLSAQLCLRIRSDIPIIYTTLEDDYLTIFTTRRVKAAQSDLLAAIATLPQQEAVPPMP